MSEASTHVLFEQIERSTVSWQISRVVDVPTTVPGRINAVFADEGNIGIDTEPMRAQPGRQVSEVTKLSALELNQGDRLVAVVDLYKTFGCRWKRNDMQWRTPK